MMAMMKAASLALTIVVLLLSRTASVGMADSGPVVLVRVPANAEALWRLFDSASRATSIKGTAAGVSICSFAAPIAAPDGRFVILN
jgi:hypothetical protein